MVTAMVTVISLVLMISGIVLKNALLLLASVISWIIFAFLMFSYTFDNAAINMGLLMFGGAMAFISLFMTIGIWVPGKKGQMNPEDADYEAYKKKVQNATRRR